MSNGSGLRPTEAARRAARQLAELTARDHNGVVGLERTDDGWRILVELVEVSRVPATTDVLGLYEVWLDDQGDLLRYERLRRYIRSQSGDDEG